MRERRAVMEIRMMRFDGGPLTHDAQAPDAWGWPLPDRLAVLQGQGEGVDTCSLSPIVLEVPVEAVVGLTGGRCVAIYRKVKESQLPEAVPGVARGAEYELEWSTPQAELLPVGDVS